MTFRQKPVAILFDLDGTLADTAPDFYIVVNEMCKARGLPPVGDSFRTTVSGGARSMILDTFGRELPDTEMAVLREEFLNRYAEILGAQSRLFAGIPELLTELHQRSIAWGVVTNKPERFTTPLLRSLGIAENCGSCICPDHVAESKPAPDGLLLACEQMNCDPQQTVYVGDHARDIQAGRNAQMQTVAVRYGYIPEGESADDWQADFVVDVASEIARLIPEPLAGADHV